jgi:hypothetical protein
MNDLNTLDDPIGLEPIAQLSASIEGLRAEIDVLRSEVARLDSDLTESRKLNLRAAELLDLAYERIGTPG